MTYAWDLDDDGAFDDATGVTANFDRVGQDGVFTVSGEGHRTDGGSDVDDATVTVTNVAPTVTGLASDAPGDENTVLTITGVVSDPGWLDPLTATVDWGDGAGPQPDAGTLENVRPDATLTFIARPHLRRRRRPSPSTVCGATTTPRPARTVRRRRSTTSTRPRRSTRRARRSSTAIPTFIVPAGEPITFSAESTDPGSDDLTHRGTGTTARRHRTSRPLLVNPPTPGPRSEPERPTPRRHRQPRPRFGDACLYEVVFAADDDDGGSARRTR